MSPTTMASQNADALDYFIQSPVSQEMITYLAKATSQVIRCDSPPQILAKPHDPLTPPPSPPAERLPSLEEYITAIVQRSHVQVPTLMTSLVYLDRLQSRLPQVAKGMACTLHRIFLAALILAAKNLNDSSPKNKHWARYTTVKGYPGFGFSITEVNLMEKQMLFLLDWDLRVREEDLFHHFEPFLAPIRLQLEQERIRQQQQQKQAQLLLEQAQIQRRHCYTYSANSSVTSSRPPSLSPSSRSSSMSSPATDCLESPLDDRAPHQYRFTESESDDDVVFVREAPVKLPPMHRMRSYDDEMSKPAKKARIGATPGFLARLLNSAPRVMA